MGSNLFNEFGAVSSKLWKQKIQYELEGLDYNATLVWESAEGIKVKPFYHSAEAKAPLATLVITTPFKIGQDIYVQDVAKSAARAQSTVQRGAEAIRFTLANTDTDAALLLQGLDSNIPAYFYLKSLSTDFAKKLDTVAATKQAQYYLMADPIGYLAKEGNWYGGGDNFTQLKEIANNCPNISVVSVNSSLYQNAGANMVQQLAYTLAHANEYFNLGYGTKPLVLEMSVGGNYFFEIAKLRAMRILYATLAKEYDADSNCHILATPTRRNKTLYESNINSLRTTAECTAAILGGADTVVNLPYDVLYRKSNEFSDRIARNQLLILKHESNLGTTPNPVEGTYYIEELTAQLAEKALVLFKEIEAGGGLLQQLKTGNLQRKIQQSAAHEQELFNNGKEVLVGINKYTEDSEQMAGAIELYPFVKTKPRKTLIVPIIEKRLAEKLEQQRLESETAQSEKGE
ncbi:methylmalonyl-CoA mutase subunit beta [Flavobacterium sp. RHBU_3]|uniref:methylmalonyl-CoA mutase subunit beta n=1 Tax=Flavobacterium sp. RHBU_3 TaxID=3391184 RepID=UPI003984F6C4